MKNILFLDNYDEDLFEIKKIIRTNLKGKDRNIDTLMRSLNKDGGKMLRSVLVLISGSFGQIERDRLRNIASAVEIMHLATLVHDDIIDDAPIRRGKETIHINYGVKTGIFVGDYLFSQSYVLFSKNVSSQSIIDVSETIKFICSGEINQFFSKHSKNATIKDYLKRTNSKCASLLSLSLSIGAYEGNANISIVKKLRKIGYYMGMAFQLIDDILDITSSKEILGKPSGNDIIEGIYTLPVLYELKKGNDELLKYLKEKNVAKVIKILQKADGLKISKSIAKNYSVKALKLVAELPDRIESTILQSIIQNLLIRKY